MNAPLTSPVCIVGVGSPFGDDQLGWQVLALLQSQLPQFNYSKCYVPSRELLPILRDFPQVVIIDALHTADSEHDKYQIGTILHWQGLEAIRHAPASLSSHGLDVVNTVLLAAQLGWQPKQLYFYGIEIDISTCHPAALNSPLTPMVSSAITALIEELNTLLQNL